MMPQGSAAPSTPRLFLLITALVTGAIVMALEILGSRLLAPVFGNSLFVWGALIGIILAAMSSGYAFGGWASDRYRVAAVLAWLLLGSGAWTVLMSWMGQAAIFKVATLIEDPRWGPSLAACVLLAPPAFGLSGVMPALLRLAVVDMGYLGRHTGSMIALSTVGSLAGTWGTAFFLLSWLGTQTLVASLGMLQLLLGLLWLQQGSGKISKMTGVFLTGLLMLSWQLFGQAPPVAGLVHQEDSPYQQVRVRDDDLFRYLVLDRTWHAVMWRSDPTTLFLPYSQLMVAAVALAPEPKRGLILGHGGGSLAKWLAQVWPELELDVVEFDPAVVRMAEEYFEYHPPANHHVFVKDARVFLRDTKVTYDVIWVDAFARHLIPFHLTTVEFFSELRSRLNPNGVLALNLASSGEGGDLQRANAVVQTLKTAFPTIESFGVKGPWRAHQTTAENLIFFGGGPIDRMPYGEVVTRIQSQVEARRLPPEATALLAARRVQPWLPGLTLTDDYTPYDLLIGSHAAEMSPDGKVLP
ncbi:MAG: fused MFS/spermidine synthase [Nitrospira sp.]|nr:fused MFS/spermidine synthase [Nitrospira sp.]MBP6607702.1 fused MFS/spermidine synthase [Nitrospira sp.]HQY57373.1 fused MFS/spermidine synthase [Nitrospira sp.]HRA98240.1 fused MFS/spermidine synthase [Nitrospira sp.]